MPFFQKIFIKMFGADWSTSVVGLFAGVCSFLAFYPEALTPLPDYWENLVQAVVAFAAAYGITQLGFSSRSSTASLKDRTQATEERHSTVNKVTKIQSRITKLENE